MIVVVAVLILGMLTIVAVALKALVGVRPGAFARIARFLGGIVVLLGLFGLINLWLVPATGFGLAARGAAFAFVVSPLAALALLLVGSAMLAWAARVEIAINALTARMRDPERGPILTARQWRVNAGWMGVVLAIIIGVVLLSL